MYVCVLLYVCADLLPRLSRSIHYLHPPPNLTCFQNRKDYATLFWRCT